MFNHYWVSSLCLFTTWGNAGENIVTTFCHHCFNIVLQRWANHAPAVNITRTQRCMPSMGHCCVQRWADIGPTYEYYLSVGFLLYANILGSTVLRCLVKNVFFVRLLGVSLVVMEWQPFPGSRFLAKYCAESSSEWSFTISILGSTCRWSTLDILWQPIAIIRDSFSVYCVYSVDYVA